MVVLRNFDSKVSTGDATCSSCCRCFNFFCFACCERPSVPGTCTISGSLSSSEELLTSATGGGGGCGTVAPYELPLLVNRFDPFGGMVDVVNCKNTKNDAKRSSYPYSRSVLSPYSLRTTYAGIRTPSAASVLSAYCVRTHLRTVDFAAFRIRAVYVLSPYYIRTLYADSADICTLIWSADRVRTPWTEYGLSLIHI